MIDEPGTKSSSALRRSFLRQALVLLAIGGAIALLSLYLQRNLIAWPYRFGFHFMTPGKPRFQTFWSLGAMAADGVGLGVMTLSILRLHTRRFVAACVILLVGWIVIAPIMWFVPHFLLIPFTD